MSRVRLSGDSEKHVEDQVSVYMGTKLHDQCSKCEHMATQKGNLPRHQHMGRTLQ